MQKNKKIDLHVHSKFSNRPQIFMLSKVKTGECYTEPESIYDSCKERGMDFVTITDHDSIQGALEISHLDDTFISEEITAIFPNDKTDVHVVALDISEEQHREISKLRYNIYDLALYLRRAKIPHFVAHPLSREKKSLKPEHIEQLILMFKVFEGRNGTRDIADGLAFSRLLNNLTPKHFARWSQKHKIEPVDWNPKRYLVGGSDDHGFIGIARAWTEFDVRKDGVSGIRDAFFNGRMEMGGKYGTAESLSHTIYYVTAQYFAKTASRSVFSAFDYEDDHENGASNVMTPAALRYKILRETVEAALEEDGKDISISDLLNGSHKDEAQKIIGNIGRGIIHRFLTHFFDEFLSSVKNIDLDRVFDSIPGLLTASSVLLPYLFGYRYHVRDREECEKLVADMGFGYPEDIKPRVAIFSDTGFDVNGVTISLRQITAAMRNQGNDVELVFCANAPPEQEAEWLRQSDFVRVLNPVGTFELPEYSEMEMGVPSLIDVMNYLADGRVAVVQISTPGPLGLVAGAAAKLMGIPVVANFHTEVHKFVDRIIGDQKVTEIVSAWVGWFYRQADKVIVPSRAAAESMRELDVNPDRIVILPRGVDTTRFDPKKRTTACWSEFGMNGACKVIYVGRVSKEKGLDVLFEAFRKVKTASRNEELVIIGDGPYLEELERKYADKSVHFMRYRHGEQLAKMYASADILAFPSENDTYGNAVVEAHASGLPVVVVDRGGPQEQVTHGKNGFIINAGNADAMSDALRYLIENPSIRERMGKAGRQRVESLAWEKAAEAQWRFYMDVWGRDYYPIMTDEEELEKRLVDRRTIKASFGGDRKTRRSA